MVEQPVDLLRAWVVRQAGDQADWFAGALDAMGSERDLHIDCRMRRELVWISVQV